MPLLPNGSGKGPSKANIVLATYAMNKNVCVCEQRENARNRYKLSTKYTVLTHQVREGGFLYLRFVLQLYL